MSPETSVQCARSAESSVGLGGCLFKFRSNGVVLVER